MNVSTTGRRDRRREETHERIYEAALAEFRAEGYGNAQVDRIAAAAGVVRGTFYFHFPSKEHVLLELRGRCIGAVIERIGALDAATVDLDALLRALIDGVRAWEHVEPDRNLLRELAALEMRTPPPSDGPGPAVRGVAAILHELEARGQLRPGCDCDMLAEIVISSAVGIVLRTLGEPERRGPLLTGLFELIQHGMLERGEG